jgi:gas vesicle protein
MRIGRYESSEGGNVGTAVTFLLIGLGAGALAGLLLAPKSGKQLRRDISRGYDDAKETLGDWADEARGHIREAGERVRDVSADLADAAREKAEPIRRAINRS